MWISLIPALAAILLAIKSKQVIPSLFAGLWLGSLLLTRSFLGSFFTAAKYMARVMTDPGNVNVLMFLYIFSGLVALIQISGGIQAFAKLTQNLITNARRTLLALWLLLPITFVDCGFRVVATGAIIKPLAKQHNIAKERLAYMLNNSASPTVILIPFANTYVAYVYSIIYQGLNAAGIQGSAFNIFVKSIVFNFFSFFAIAIALLSIIPQLNFRYMKEIMHVGSNNKAHKPKEHIPDKAQNAKDQTGTAMKGSAEHDHSEMNQGDLAIKQRLVNILVPIVTLISLSFYLMLGSNDQSKSMLVALIITTTVTVIFYLVQGVDLSSLVGSFVKGGNKLMATIVILLLAWPLSDVSQELGLGDFMTSTLGESVSPLLVPVLIFIITAATSYFTGSSWGSWALMMPVAIPLAAITGAHLPMTVAATLSGGTFGDVTSPVSGMTAMAAGITEADHMKYIRAMTPYNFTAAILAAIAFTAVAYLL